MTIRDVPSLARTLDALADEHVYLRAPDLEGQPQRWLPCSRPGCGSVTTVPANVVGTICEDCALPCPHTDCGLLIHEHYDDNGSRIPCEPPETD